MRLDHFSVTQLVELDACTRCGQCITWCPSFSEAQDDGTHPLNKIMQEKQLLRRQFGLFARLLAKRSLDGWVAQLSSGAYRCTLCARCSTVCPIGLRTRELWIAMREQMVELGQYPEALNRLREKVTSRHNIIGEENEARGIWAENLPVKPEGLFGRRNAEVVYFVGCVSAMFPATYAIPQSLTQIMTRAGVDFTTLGGEEWCCGLPLLLAGMRDAALDLMRHNVETVRAMGARQLIASCPSCYHTWHDDYPRLLGEPLGFDVVHSTEVLADLIERNKITLGPLAEKVTYHDPCDLGRTSGILDEPRYVLNRIPGLTRVEMSEHRERSLCCGGGGNLEMVEPALSAGIAGRRVQQAQATGAGVIVSACPQCKRTLTRAVRAEKAGIGVLDIAELVWKSVEEQA